MAKLFISHSSKDKKVVQQLALDLKGLGHQVWLDQWEIRVGDCIVSKVQTGLAQADYVVLVLSKHAVDSGWVEKEWKSKYWDEIQDGRAIVLPVLLETCDIPQLLKSKKYADFRENPRTALAQLATAIQPLVSRSADGVQIDAWSARSGSADEVSNLLGEINSGDVPISQAISKAIGLGQRTGAEDLVRFCQDELAGYGVNPTESPEWRCVEAYVSVTAQLNPEYFGFAGNASAAWDHLRNGNEHFFPVRMCLSYPVAHLEARSQGDPTKRLHCVEMTVGDFLPDGEHPDAPVAAYLRGDAFTNILTAVKVELTKRLLMLLPSAEQ